MAGYSEKAQPYLDAIAASIFSSEGVRDWLLVGTRHAVGYMGATPLLLEQQAVRWYKGPTKQPFWANYFCGRESNCSCRIEGSKSLESDAIFFLRNALGRVIAIHVEFKHTNEPLKFGQAESYPRRAACFVESYQSRRTVNAHDDWVTVIFCGARALSDPRLSNFDRVITHEEAIDMIAGYPSS